MRSDIVPGDYGPFHGWDRRAPGSMPTSYQ
jgi:hypothetical protein